MNRVLEPEVMESKSEATTFDSYQKRTMHYWWPRLIKEFKGLNIKPNSKILDVAAGPANLSIRLAQHYKSKIWATDLSNEMLKKARKNVKKAKTSNVVIIKDDVKNMQFEDNLFDFTFCRYTLHQIQTPLKVVNELWRVTKKGGKIYIHDTVRPKNKKNLEIRMKHHEPNYKKLKIKNPGILLKNARDSIIAGSSKEEIISLFKKSKLKHYKLKFQKFYENKKDMGSFTLIASK